MACDLLTEEDLDVLRENIAIWKMYMERKQTDKILQFDKEFHRHFYEMCDRNYWCTLLESLSPHFDRTTVLSFRCRPVNGIVSDHEELVDAIAARDRERRRRPPDGICSATPRILIRSGRISGIFCIGKETEGYGTGNQLRQNRS